MSVKLASSITLASLFAGSLALAASLAPSEAQACGGTFCDLGPTAMPVDQTGENILFHIGPDYVEAHIQIQYDPESTAAAFAWVIPVTAVPEFVVGSQLLFDAVLNASVPSYGMAINNDSCGGESGGVPLGGDGDGDGDGDTGGGGDPQVVLETTVGAFDIAVLDGGTVEGVMQWLADNNYQQDPNAAPILAEYLAQQYLFVAMKLSNQADVDEIHPIVIRYGGTDSCVPIRLTRIAAVDDMDIRVFFLQDARVVPINYRHVLVNPLKLDWINNAANYKEVITMAVDAQEADGNAFVTEYAGPSGIVPTFQINPGWSAAPFPAYVDSPVGVIEELASQGLIDCDPQWGVECSYPHPLVAAIVHQFIPVPAGIDENTFYGCLSCNMADIDLTAWDAVAFAAMLDDRVVKPAENAVALLAANPYLTRLYTTISPLEMNADPVFRVNTMLPDVPNIRIATQTIKCDGSATVTLPDGRTVVFKDANNMVWPEFDEAMPWEEDIDEEGMANNAPLINLVDNTQMIDDLLNAYNERERANVPADGEGGGCACAIDDTRSGAPLGLALLGLLGLSGLSGMVRRRR